MDVSDLATKLDLIEKRWKGLLLELQRGKTAEKRPKSGEQLREDMLQLRAWFIEAETLLTINPPPRDLTEGFEKVSEIQMKLLWHFYSIFACSSETAGNG